MDQFVIRKSLDHKQGKVDTTRYVAFKNRIADVAAPYRQALALPLFEFASTHDSPPTVTSEHSPTSFNLVVENLRCGQAVQATRSSSRTL